jgi:hypothetical protein
MAFDEILIDEGAWKRDLALGDDALNAKQITLS